MWTDAEADRDFLNFSVMAKIAAQTIIDSDGKPLSIGITGGWGVGKSTMVKLIEKSFIECSTDKHHFITFNAWLYQGLDDSKAALMEQIARSLLKKAESDKSIIDKGIDWAKELLGRIDLVRAARVGGEIALTAATGIPVSPLVRGVEGIYDHLTDGEISASDVTEAKEKGAEIAKQATGTLRDKKKKETPPQLIEGFREYLSKLLEKMNITLVVFVDDLDRCLPQTVIGTLEAMRLFLFLDRTAFVIAADEKMIKEAVRFHFGNANLDDDLIVNYFDKLIQVPLRVPPLGVNEVRAYMMLLYVDDSNLDHEIKEKIYNSIVDRLSKSWTGDLVNPDFIKKIEGFPENLGADIDLAARLAPQMVSSPRILGNPRLIKRFMNTVSIRSKIAEIHGIGVGGDVLAKILLFERCASSASFELFVRLVNGAGNGAPDEIGNSERMVRDGGALSDPALQPWIDDKAFVEDWLRMDPTLEGMDLRGALHVGKENITPKVETMLLSHQGSDLLNALLGLTSRPHNKDNLMKTFSNLSKDEREFIVGRLISRARNEATWGTPNVLWAMSIIAEYDPAQTQKIIQFFDSISSRKLEVSLVARLITVKWGKEVLAIYERRLDIPQPFKKAIENIKNKGGHS